LTLRVKYKENWHPLRVLDTAVTILHILCIQNVLYSDKKTFSFEKGISPLSETPEPEAKP